jgi:type II secretory pathway component PulF
MDLPPSPLNLRLAELGRSAPMWAPWIPIAALLALLFWWAWSKRATTSSPRWWSFSSSRRLLYYSQLTTFADLLALLIEHGTPLGQAVVLAADAGGDKRLKKSAHEFAQFVAAGIKTNQPAAEGHPQRLNDVKETAPALAGFPPLVNWLLIAGGSQATLVDSLRNVARAYQHRVERLDDWLRLYLPLSLIVVVGGSGVVIYAISLLGPWYQMLTHLGDSLR